MLAWVMALGLRVKLYALAAGAALLFVGVLYARFRMARAKAASSTQRANALEAARRTEKRVADKRLELSLRQRQIREQLAARQVRDGMDGQGWGP